MAEGPTWQFLGSKSISIKGNRTFSLRSFFPLCWSKIARLFHSWQSRKKLIIDFARVFSYCIYRETRVLTVKSSLGVGHQSIQENRCTAERKWRVKRGEFWVLTCEKSIEEPRSVRERSASEIEEKQEAESKTPVKRRRKALRLASTTLATVLVFGFHLVKSST